MDPAESTGRPPTDAGQPDAGQPDAGHPDAGQPVTASGRVAPEAFLSEAERLLGEGAGPAGVWPRACVWLTRLALETALDELWAARLPEARGIPMRAQLLLLPHHLGSEATEQARRAWLGLSRAAHHHRVELAPTVAELRGWQSSVTAVVTAVAAVSR